MTIEVYDDRYLPDHLAWQCVSFDRCTFPELVDESLPWGPRPYPPDRRSRHIVAVAGPVLLGAATIVRTVGSVAGADVVIDGVGSVFTYPARRGQGVGRAVLGVAGELIDSGDTDAAVLFCAEERRNFYAACGWVLAGAPTLVGPTRVPCQDKRMVRFVSDRARGLGQLMLTEPLAVPYGW